MDIELLIRMVRDRPVLWDKTCKEYNKECHSRAAWDEICMAVVPELETMDPKEQQVLKHTLMNKWNDIKHSWLRWRRKATRKHKVDDAQIKSLNPIDSLNKLVQSQSSLPSVPLPLQPPPLDVPPPAKRVATNSLENENRHLSFFKSILPSIVCFSDDETLEFQVKVLSTIQGIKRTRRLNMT